MISGCDSKWKGGWVILMRFGVGEKGRRDRSSKYAQNIHHLFHARQYLISCFGYLFTSSSVNVHLLNLDIYSLNIWPLNPNIFIHLMRKYVRSLNLFVFIYLFGKYIRSVRADEFQHHVSLLPLSGCLVARLKCPSGVIWHFGDNTSKSHQWRWRSGG